MSYPTNTMLGWGSSAQSGFSTLPLETFSVSLEMLVKLLGFKIFFVAGFVSELLLFARCFRFPINLGLKSALFFVAGLCEDVHSKMALSGSGLYQFFRNLTGLNIRLQDGLDAFYWRRFMFVEYFFNHLWDV